MSKREKWIIAAYVLTCILLVVSLAVGGWLKWVGISLFVLCMILLHLVDRCAVCGGYRNLPHQRKFCEQCGAEFTSIKPVLCERIRDALLWLSLAAFVAGWALEESLLASTGGLLSAFSSLFFRNVRYCSVCDTPLHKVEQNYCACCGVKRKQED